MNKVLSLIIFVFLVTVVCFANEGFKIYELGHTTFYWNMQKTEVLEALNQYTKELEKVGGECKLSSLDNGQINLFCRGSLEHPNNRIYENTYSFFFAQDRLLKIELLLDMGIEEGTGLFSYAVGSKRNAVNMQAKDIKDFYTLKFGAPIISEEIKTGWSTGNEIVVLNNYSTSHQIRIEYYPKN